VTAAVFGLIGVLVGAAIPALVAWLTTRRAEERGLRAAARLIEERLEPLPITVYDLRAAILMGAETPAAAAAVVTGFRPDAWESRRELFAAALPYDEWNLLMRAHLDVADLRSRLEEPGGPGVREGRLREVEGTCRAAVDLLGRLGGAPDGDPSTLRAARWGRAGPQ
jgi:hypothetical protein